MWSDEDLVIAGTATIIRDIHGCNHPVDILELEAESVRLSQAACNKATASMTDHGEPTSSIKNLIVRLDGLDDQNAGNLRAHNGGRTLHLFIHERVFINGCWGKVSIFLPG